MPRKQLNCCQVIKEMCLTHRHFSKTRNAPRFYSGSTLCSFIGDGGKGQLKDDEEYRVCWELKKKGQKVSYCKSRKKEEILDIKPRECEEN